MARQFGSYSPVVPLGVTWREPLVMEDEQGEPVDLTGYAVRAQLRDVPAAGVSPPVPVIEFTTAGYYGSPPAWPVVVGFTLPDAVGGSILLTAEPVQFAEAVSPTNTKRKLLWEIVLVNEDTGETIPVLAGRVSFLPAVTLP